MYVCSLSNQSINPIVVEIDIQGQGKQQYYSD